MPAALTHKSILLLARERIRQLLPTTYNGDTFVGMDRYSQEVQARTQMTVPAFEEATLEAPD